MELGDLLASRIPGDPAVVRATVAALDELIVRAEQVRAGLDFGAAATRNETTASGRATHARAVELRDRLSEQLRAARHKRDLVAGYADRLESRRAAVAAERAALDAASADLELLPLTLPAGDDLPWWAWTRVSTLVDALSAAEAAAAPPVASVGVIDAVYLAVVAWRRGAEPGSAPEPPTSTAPDAEVLRWARAAAGGTTIAPRAGAADAAGADDAAGTDPGDVLRAAEREVTVLIADHDALACHRVWLAGEQAVVARVEDTGVALRSATVAEASALTTGWLGASGAASGREMVLADRDLVESLFSPDAVARARCADRLAEALPLLGVGDLPAALTDGTWRATCVADTWCDDRVVDGRGDIVIRGGGAALRATPSGDGVRLVPASGLAGA